MPPLEGVTFFEELVNFDQFRRGHAEEGGLDFHTAVERKIVSVHHDRRAGVLIQLRQAAHVIDVRVGADDGFDGELVAAEETKEAFDFVTRIDDDALKGARVTDDGTIALQHANRDFEIDHLRIGRVGHAVGGSELVHGESIPLAFWRIIACGAVKDDLRKEFVWQLGDGRLPGLWTP